MYRIITLITISVSLNLSAFDHSYATYGQLLDKYVKDGNVDYESMIGSPDLQSISALFASVDSNRFNRFSLDERIAFLVNAYNFHTIELIVQHLPLKNGIRDIPKPWDTAFIPLFGGKISLNHIEHDLLRKKYNEPRIHFALVCASKSCPELYGKPFTPFNLDRQLDNAGKRFLHDSSRNRIKGKTVYLSRIFKWYAADFNSRYKGGFREYVGSVLGIPIVTYKITFLPYDWSLNRVQK